MASDTSNYPEFVFVAYDEDFSAQTHDVAVSLEAGSLVGTPVKYVRHDANHHPTPVAPVSPDATGKCGELETAIANLEEIQLAAFGSLGSEPDIYADYDRLCELSRKMREAIQSCSQAVELLAAEIRRERDLAEKQLSEVVDRMSDDYLALKAELDQAVGVIEDRSAEYEALEAKVAAAKDLISRAQEIIPGNYMHWHDFARAVLGGKPS